MKINRADTLLTNDGANIAFGEACAVGGDYSIQALMRAVVIERSEWTVESLKDLTKVGYHSVGRAEDVAYVMSQEFSLTVCGTAIKVFENIELNEAWIALDKAPYPVNQYLSQIARTKVFVNKGEKRAIAFVENRVSPMWIQAFMSMFPLVLTWYFSSPLTKEEKTFYKTISVDSKISADEVNVAFVSYINEAAQKIDLRDITMRNLLMGYENKVRDRLIEDKRRDFNRISNKIADCTYQLTKHYEEMVLIQEALRGFESISSDNSNRLYEFFAMHKQLSVLSSFDTNIEFGVVETIEYYDEDEFKAVAANPNSYLNRRATPETIRAFRAIFEDHRGAFVTNAVFSLGGMRYVNTVVDKTVVQNAMPHPHITFFGCSGGNAQYYTKYAESGDWDLAIEQAICATKNINFGDSTVISEMIKWIESNTHVPCIRVPGKEYLLSMNEFLTMIGGNETNG